MPSFEELLNMPIPSKTNEEANTNEVITESVEETATEESIDNELENEVAQVATEDDGEDVSLDDIDDASDDDDEDDGFAEELDGMSDADLMALDAELGGDALDAVANGDGNEEVTLTPQEEMRADDLMASAATAMLVKDELTAQEKVDFLSNEAELDRVVSEGFLTTEDVTGLITESVAEGNDVFTEGKYNSKMIIRLNKEAKMKQLFALGVNVSAAAHGDKDYVKLKKVMKMRKILRAKLQTRYRSEGMKRAKIYMQRLNKSGSKTLQALAQK